MAERLVPFSQATSQDLENLQRVNWIAKTRSGEETPDWSEVVDSRYGTLRHVAIINDETGVAFDKVDLDWSSAAFVVIYRQKEGRTEFLLPSERRVLLKDENGEQGNVVIRNIPQGLVRIWENETEQRAALREVKEETGIEPKSIIRIRNIYFDAANSQTAMPFFLAEVDADELQTYRQSLDSDEDIKVSEEDWFAIEDIQELEIQCAKTLSGLMLATGYLGLWPKSQS